MVVLNNTEENIIVTFRKIQNLLFLCMLLSDRRRLHEWDFSSRSPILYTAVYDFQPQ